MGNLSFAAYLSDAEKNKLDNIISAYRYRRLDAIRTELAGHGIHPTRSALGRYIKAERERLESLPVLDTPTTITIVDCRSGRAEIVYSVLSAEEIRRRIAS